MSNKELLGMLSITQLSIVIAADSNNPSLLNPDFLKFNGIVPEDWESGDSTVTTGVVSQVTFVNGITIVAEPNKMNFVERIDDNDYGSLFVPEVAQKYLQTLPHVRYTAVGNNLMGHIGFKDLDEARSYSARLIAKGPWFDINSGIHQASVKFVYMIDQGQLVLSIEPGQRSEGEDQSAVVVFVANFHREIVGDNSVERLTSALGIIGKWKEDIAFYEKAISEAFLGGGK